MKAQNSLPLPKTLQEAIEFFSDPDRAFEYACKLRWPDGDIKCPRCGSRKHSFIKSRDRRLWYCYDCKRQFTVKVKTVFEDSAVPLSKWMIAVWMLVACKNGISSYELSGAVGVTQRTAWFMLQRIRKALHQGSFGKIGGGTPESEVEVDETWIGGKAKNMHKDRRLRYEQLGGHHGKTVVQGILDRDIRKIRATVIPNTSREVLQGEVLNNVKYGTRVYSDNAVGYDNLNYRFIHEFVNHAERYVDGRIHTNGLENFWSLLKRTLRGTYVAVEPFHLYRYVGWCPARS